MEFRILSYGILSYRLVVRDFKFLLVSPSPHLPISPSPCLPISPSPHLPPIPNYLIGKNSNRYLYKATGLLIALK